MSSNCCSNNDPQEFKSLVFNAGSMNDGTESIPDTVSLGSDGSAIQILGWLLPQRDTDEYSLTFSVPRDARNGRQRAKVFVHLLIDSSNTPITPDTVFAIRLSSLFTRANAVVRTSDIQTNNSGNIPVRKTPANFQYDHYVLEFNLDDIIMAEDFALLSVARTTLANNDYTGALLLTSIEFRYLSR